MARAVRDTVIVKGVVYYTSNYFVKQTAYEVMGNKNALANAQRQARKFLEGYSSIDKHTNPKLYSKAEMDKAINDYRTSQGLSREELEQKREELRAKEEAGEWEDLEFEEKQSQFDEVRAPSNNQDDPEESYWQYLERQISSDIKEYKEKNLLKDMLQATLFCLGYEFDVERYEDDINYDIREESYRDYGVTRSKKHREARRRLQSPKSYLVKKS